MGKNYDVIIIGGGVAGCEAAEQAATRGLSVLLIERDMIGGTCLNSGCIPSKYYLSAAHNFENYQTKKDIFKGRLSLDFEELVRQQQKAVGSLRDGMGNSLKSLGVEILHGEAKIKELDSKIIIAAGEEEFCAKDLIIATGSQAALPRIEGLKDEIANGFVCTNKELFKLDKLPESLVIIGGGVSGIEMAYAFNSFGSNVTVIEALDRIISGFDLSFAADIQKILERKGIKFVLNGLVKDICEGCVCVSVQEKEMVFECDNVYLCTGRKISCEEMRKGFKGLSGDRFLNADEYCRTGSAHVYAIGDVNGRSLLAHSAIHQAQIVVDKICGIENEHTAALVPQIIYINPECIQIGENEESARAKKQKFEEVSVSMNYSGRYVAVNGKMSGEGKIKLLIDEHETIIGACMISNYASEIAMTLNLLISEKITCEEIMQYVFPHPTEGEIIRKCVNVYKQKHLR